MHAHDPVGMHRQHRLHVWISYNQSVSIPPLRLVRRTLFDTYSGLLTEMGPTQYDTSSPLCLVSPLGFHWLCIPLGVFNYLTLLFPQVMLTLKGVFNYIDLLFPSVMYTTKCL